jgi:hypothetical protein
MFCMAALVVRYDDASVLMDFDYIPHAVALARVARLLRMMTRLLMTAVLYVRSHLWGRVRLALISYLRLHAYVVHVRELAHIPCNTR